MDALEHVHARLTSCRVLVEAPARRQHHGGQFRVGIDLALPAGRLVVGRSPHDRPGHEDVCMAIGDAFRAARRRLEDRVRRRRQPIPLGGAEPAATETS